LRSESAPLYAWYRDNYVGQGISRTDWRSLPLIADDQTNLPPTILLYAGFDSLRDEGAAYVLKLTLAGVPIELLYFSDMIHGFLTMGGAVPAAPAALKRISGAFNDLGKRHAF
jgi:acetyl esterase